MISTRKLALISVSLLLAVLGVLIVAAPQSASPEIPLSGTFTATLVEGSGTYDPTTGEITAGTITTTHTLSGDINGQRTTTATYDASEKYWYLSELPSDCTVTFNNTVYQGKTFGRASSSSGDPSPPGCYPELCTFPTNVSSEGAVWTIEEPYALIRVTASGSGTFNMTWDPSKNTWEILDWHASGTWSGSLEFLSVEAQMDETASGSLTLEVPGEGAGVLTYDTTGTGAVLMGIYESNPAGPPPGLALERFIEIYTNINSPEINWPIELRVYYSDAEVEAAGIDELTLKMYKWDGSNWVVVDESGVNTEENYVWANLYSFSTYVAIGESAGGCFIATAAYGTDTAEQINVLRAFRDQVLLQNALGSQLVALYYEVSPPLAGFISEHEPLRIVVRELLVEPIVGLTKFTQGIWGN